MFNMADYDSKYFDYDPNNPEAEERYQKGMSLIEETRTWLQSPDGRAEMKNAINRSDESIKKLKDARIIPIEKLFRRVDI
jgi:hypothetical protein